MSWERRESAAWTERDANEIGTTHARDYHDLYHRTLHYTPFKWIQLWKGYLRRKVKPISNMRTNFHWIMSPFRIDCFFFCLNHELIRIIFSETSWNHDWIGSTPVKLTWRMDWNGFQLWEDKVGSQSILLVTGRVIIFGTWRRWRRHFEIDHFHATFESILLECRRKSSSNSSFWMPSRHNHESWGHHHRRIRHEFKRLCHEVAMVQDNKTLRSCSGRWGHAIERSVGHWRCTGYTDLTTAAFRDSNTLICRKSFVKSLSWGDVLSQWTWCCKYYPHSVEESFSPQITVGEIISVPYSSLFMMPPKVTSESSRKALNLLISNLTLKDILFCSWYSGPNRLQ